MSQEIPYTVSIQLNHAELQLPTRDDEKPELELRGRIVSNIRIVLGNGEDISRYNGAVSITRSDEERDHAGSVWVEPKERLVTAVLYAGVEAFDRIVAQLSGPPREQQIQLGLAGMRRTDEDGGTLEWHSDDVKFGQSLLYAQLNARLF